MIRKYFAQVILFKESGKYYATEYWRIPDNYAVGPQVMVNSPDFHPISNSAPILIPTQDPWGYPHLIIP